MLHVEDGKFRARQGSDPANAGRVELKHHRADRDPAGRKLSLHPVFAHDQPRPLPNRLSFSRNDAVSSTSPLTTKFGTRPSATASMPLTALSPVIRAQSSVQPIAC